MRRLIFIISIVSFPALLGFAVYFLAPDVLNGMRYEFLTMPVILDNHSPTGELLAGEKIEQPIFLDINLLTQAESFKPNESMCVGILFATYIRHNHGRITVSLVQGPVHISRIVEMSQVRDNAYTWLCLEKIDWLLLRTGNAHLVIEGIDGKEGSSITAWLSADIPHGPAVVNGVQNSKGLVFGIARRSTDRGVSIARWTFVLISSLSIEFILGVLFVMWAPPVKDDTGEITSSPVTDIQ